jgi:hypothetical protein
MKVSEVNVPKHMATFYGFNNKKSSTQAVTQRADMSVPA